MVLYSETILAFKGDKIVFSLRLFGCLGESVGGEMGGRGGEREREREREREISNKIETSSNLRTSFFA